MRSGHVLVIHPTSEAEIWNSVSSIVVGGNSSAMKKSVVLTTVIQHKKGA